MRIALATLVALLIPAAGGAQTTSPSTQGVLDTRIPPNAIDRATASSDARRADAARAADADRAAAQSAARTARSTQSAPIAQSTLTDGVSGLGTRPDTSAPTTTTPTPR